jgi:hypothetical protein
MAEGNALHRAVPFRMGAPPLGRLARWMNCLPDNGFAYLPRINGGSNPQKGAAVRIWLGVFPVKRLNVCVNALTSLKPSSHGNLGYMQLGVIKVSNRQIAPQLLKYFSEVQPFVRKLSGQRPFAHSQTASNVIHQHPAIRKQRRYRVLYSRPQLAFITSSIG